MENEKIEIRFNKIYLAILTFCGEGLLLGSGIYIIITSFFEFSEPLEDYFHFNPFIMKFVGIICIVFFGFTLKILIKKLFEKKPGLVIDNIGIIDNSTGLSARHIKWKNIIGFKKFNLLIIQFIAVIVDDEYLNEYYNKYKWYKFIAKLDHKMAGSPFQIYTSVLKCKQKILFNILQEKLKKCKNEI